MKLIITCEHGGNEIPAEHQYLFDDNLQVLQTHKGLDIGALSLYEYLQALADFSIYSTTSRLLIELNRSLHHKNLFSEYATSMPASAKTKLIDNYYLAYRNKVEKSISNYINEGHEVLHISVHSFTPVLNNIKRNCDIGLLYDSSKLPEKEFSHQFKKKILAQNSGLNVRFNYPYLGKADGFTTYLRKQFTSNYIGIEIEVNQKFAVNNVMDAAICEVLLKGVES